MCTFIIYLPFQIRYKMNVSLYYIGENSFGRNIVLALKKKKALVERPAIGVSTI